jgi:dynein heavy chain, axonemal
LYVRKSGGFTGGGVCPHPFLFPECRYNKLLETMQSSLSDLQKALKGAIVMSQDLDEMYSSILIDEVPGMWRQVAYPSRKPLSPWMVDLQSRLSFFQSWLEQGPPLSFCLPAFFFPQVPPQLFLVD